jgi:putative oxidoreductase
MKFLVVLGRLFYSLIFILASFGHFSKPSIQYAAQNGVPMAEILVPLSGIIAFLGGVSILTGYKAKYGAWLLILFLVPVTFMMHKFWLFQDPVGGMIEKIMFMKNLSLLGSACLISYFGSGPFSLKS